MSSNPLAEVIPAKARKAAYAAFSLVGVGLGAVPVYCAATGTETPTQILGALAVYAFIGAPLFGATAAANVNNNGGQA